MTFRLAAKQPEKQVSVLDGNFATINRLCDQLAEQHGIVILMANEAGSRAWGYSRDGSDSDILFVYLQKPWAVKIEAGFKDSIHQTFKEYNVSFRGYELRAYYRHISQSKLYVHETFFNGCGHSYVQHPCKYELDEIARRYYSRDPIFSAAAGHHQKVYGRGFDQFIGTNNPAATKRIIASIRYALMAFSAKVFPTAEYEITRLFDSVHSDVWPVAFNGVGWDEEHVWSYINDREKIIDQRLVDMLYKIHSMLAVVFYDHNDSRREQTAERMADLNESYMKTSYQLYLELGRDMLRDQGYDVNRVR